MTKVTEIPILIDLERGSYGVSKRTSVGSVLKKRSRRSDLCLDQCRSAANISQRGAGVRKGEPVFRELDHCRGLLVVMTGAVKVLKFDSRGRELTLSLEMVGSSVGDLALLDGGNYPYSAEAAAELTSIWVVSRPDFLDTMRRYPEIAERGLLALGVALRRTIEIAEAQSLLTVRARLAGYLHETSAGDRVFRLPQSNEEIASRLGTVREVISRTLATLKASQVIALQGRQVTVLDEDELQRIAEQAVGKRP